MRGCGASARSSRWRTLHARTASASCPSPPECRSACPCRFMASSGPKMRSTTCAPARCPHPRCWRWLVAALVMAPFGLQEVLQKRALIRRHAGLFALLALSGVAAFQTLVYLGLRTTTAINAVLINAAGPLFMIACSWLLERDKPSLRQVSGMLISFVGVLIIVSRGNVAT